MTLLDRYVARTILGYAALALAALLTLSALWIFIGQQDDIGVGRYALGDALLFTALNLPRHAFELLPIAALIGALFGLGNLARGAELVVMRTAGISVLRLGGSAALAGVVVMLVMAIVGEFVAPGLDQYARELKTFSKFQDVSFTAGRGAWIRDGERFINVRQQSADNVFGGVYIYEIDASGRLRSLSYARSARLTADRQWQLFDFAETRLDETGVAADRADLAMLDSNVHADFLGLAAAEPASLPCRALWAFIQHLRRNDVDAAPYETAFWSRIARTVATLIVCVLAVPFAFGPLRAAGYGARTVVGVLIGVLYFLLTRTLENSAEVYGVEPVLVAWAPTLLLAVGTGFALARTR